MVVYTQGKWQLSKHAKTGVAWFYNTSLFESLLYVQYI